MIHNNSIKTYYEDLTKLNKREKVIFEFFCDNSEIMFTDRQVQQKLGFAERNMVQPRVTELIGKGLLEEAGKTKCQITGKTVRLVRKT
jgi:hypothetical protein|tara:strand:+ start:9246 stop:9509 length:264 start_codon:yes stop_codon:yes gene_type:complete